MNIGKVISGNTLIDDLSNTCPFKFIETDQYINIVQDEMECIRIQHIGYQQVSCPVVS